MTRNIYLIQQDKNDNYDTYDSAIVISDSEENAKLIHPGARAGEWWIKAASGYAAPGLFDWAAPKYVSVKWVGTTNDNFDLGTILCASFNAG